MVAGYRQIRSRATGLGGSRMFLSIICSCFFALLYIYRCQIQNVPTQIIEQHAVQITGGAYRIPSARLPSVNLVIAATSNEDYSWVKEVKIRGLVAVPYVADNGSAPHHPQKNKGHEAMMYLQYFYDFYDNLPDISILVHSQKRSWHIEQLLDQRVVLQANSAVNTTRVNEESGNPPEQKEMQESFRANFNIYDIPEILATPCCSQIAVTKERILSVPRAQYQHHIDWLLSTILPDAISGRTWEHMWQYLFLQKALDCPLEHKAYCRLYHICFGGAQEYDEWIELMQGRGRLEKELERIKKQEREEEAKVKEESMQRAEEVKTIEEEVRIAAEEIKKKDALEKEKAEHAAEAKRIKEREAKKKADEDAQKIKKEEEGKKQKAKEKRRDQENQKRKDELKDRADWEEQAKQDRIGSVKRDVSEPDSKQLKATLPSNEDLQAKLNALKAEEARADATRVAAQSTRNRTIKTLEQELAAVKEAIRIRREVAIVRGSVKANRDDEGENLYGDDIELGIEHKLGFADTTASGAGFTSKSMS